jgi:hypothetical protein
MHWKKQVAGRKAQVTDILDLAGLSFFSVFSVPSVLKDFWFRRRECKDLTQ